MTLTSGQRITLERLRREYHITFRVEFRKEDWPSYLKDVFEAILTLGQTKYDEYAVAENGNGLAEPWKLQVKRQATRLVGEATRCVRRNEACWRFACESLIFARFQAAVAWYTSHFSASAKIFAVLNCQKRIWRSEIEAAPTPNSAGAESLKARQRRREPCHCSQAFRPQDPDEINGLNTIFIDRAQDSIIHSPELMKKLPKGEQPDRVYGLQQTRNFEDKLYASLPGNRHVRDLLQRSPLSEDGHPLLFPFMVAEAKSGTSGDDWHSIKLQTAFTIYTFLEVQQTIKLATEERSRWHAGPLVWFFMNKGSDWRLCVAFQTNHTGHKFNVPRETHIVEFWAGCIRSRDGALELFLLVDYICDWARDIYRPAILNELNILSFPDANEIRTERSDSAIHSSRGYLLPRSSWELQGPTNENQRSDGTATSSVASFYDLDSRYGAVRHASFIKFRFCALFITGESLQSLLKDTQKKVMECFSRRILEQLQRGPLLLGEEQIRAIEKHWNGFSRVSGRCCGKETKFYTIIGLLCYMNERWEQVRELSAVAVAEDAFDALVACSTLQPGRWKTKKPITCVVGMHEAASMVSLIKDGSVRNNLLAAISRIARRIHLVYTHGRVHLRLSLDDGVVWELVSYVFQFVKDGRLKPTEACLQRSTRIDIQCSDTSNDGPFRFHEDLRVSPSGAVLIHGLGRTPRIGGNTKPSLCMYLVHEPLEAPHRDTLGTIIKDTFQDYDIYHTTRDNEVLDLRRKKFLQPPWNLSKTYGVHCSLGDLSFPKWLISLQVSPPTRQGSPKGPSDTGRNMFFKNYNPWRDLRTYTSDTFSIKRERVLHTLIFFEFRYWRQIARERRKQGIPCCVCCAEETLENVCAKCEEEFDAPKFPKFFANELRKGLATIEEPSSEGIISKAPLRNKFSTSDASPSILVEFEGSEEVAHSQILSECLCLSSIDRASVTTAPFRSLDSTVEESQQMEHPSRKRKRHLEVEFSKANR
ncbi:MAG: hypothetical protein M1833_005855 [Piccolia ochrophora]|nr:MAG: hypothetical protein M1833_005855 [Piccolia ochrophora]